MFRPPIGPVRRVRDPVRPPMSGMFRSGSPDRCRDQCLSCEQRIVAVAATGSPPTVETSMGTTEGSHRQRLGGDRRGRHREGPAPAFRGGTFRFHRPRTRRSRAQARRPEHGCPRNPVPPGSGRRRRAARTSGSGITAGASPGPGAGGVVVVRSREVAGPRASHGSPAGRRATTDRPAGPHPSRDRPGRPATGRHPVAADRRTGRRRGAEGTRAGPAAAGAAHRRRGARTGRGPARAGLPPRTPSGGYDGPASSRSSSRGPFRVRPPHRSCDRRGPAVAES